MAWIVGPTRWNFIERDPYNRAALLCPLGTTLSDGSSLICKNGSGVAFFVAPSASEVVRSWYNRNDSVTTAQALTGCTDWFVPSYSQLITGYNCRSFWNSYGTVTVNTYWSSTAGTFDSRAYAFDFSSGTGNDRFKTDSYRVRAFRCVTY